MEVLDRILDRHDVRGPAVIDMVDHGGERRRFSAPGRTGHEDKPSLLGGNVREHGWEPELVHRGDHHRNHADDQADRASLLEDAAAKPPQALHAVGEVDLLTFFEPRLLLRVHDGGRHRFRIGVLQARLLGCDDEAAMHAHHRVAAHLEMEVRRPAHGRDFQKIVNGHSLAFTALWRPPAPARAPRSPWDTHGSASHAGRAAPH